MTTQIDRPIKTIDLPQILDLQTVIDCINTHSAALGEFNIYSLALFGSVARNEATANSDLDFLVDFEKPITLRQYMRLKFFLEDLFDRPVDLVIKSDIKPIIRQTILDEAVYVA